LNQQKWRRELRHLKIVIITGLSGSGKSTAIAAFEDAGFYCVDNMPIDLLPKFLELPIISAPEFAGLAFVMDLREKDFLSRYDSVIESLKQKGYDFEILFLEAGHEILVKRYSETRRHHPLAQEKSLIEGIREEEGRLRELRKAADQVIDTSQYTVHALKSVILEIARKAIKLQPMRVNVQSFGFKYGIPHDADLLIDVRFIGNPHFVPELKDLDGEAEPVKEFVLSRPETRAFLAKYLDLLDFLIPRYEAEGKAYLTVAVGCTGGRHRSVALARAVFEHIRKAGNRVQLVHRDIAQ